MWRPGQEATVCGDQILVGGCWFDFDERWKVKKEGQ
jgi:hypothetical protein